MAIRRARTGGAAVALTRALLCALLGAGASLRAQASPHGFEPLESGLQVRCAQVPGARGVCAVLAVRVGTDHDPPGMTGLAEALGEALRRTQLGLPPGDRLQVRVHGAATELSAMRPADELGEVLAAFAAVLYGALELDDDLVRRAAGAAALEADDQTWIYPGSRLRAMAQRTLLAGTPGGRQTAGIPAELERLEPAQVRRWYRDFFRPRHAVLAVLGGGGEAGMTAAVRQVLAELPAGECAAPPVTVHDALGPPAAEATHDRVAAPYVTLALRAPEVGAADHVPFLCAMEVAASRAARALRDARGNESWGRFPPFSFDGATGARLVLVNRRARDGDGPERARGELEALASVLHEHGARPEEIERARAVAARRLRLPPYPDGELAPTTSARALYPRAAVLALAAVLGWPPALAEQVEAVPGERVQEVLRAAFAPERRHWFVLTPRQ